MTLPKNGSYTKGKRKTVFNETKGKCAYCGCTLELENYTVDHILPTSKGDLTRTHNLLPACKSCNADKGNKTIEEFCGIKGYLFFEKPYIRCPICGHSLKQFKRKYGGCQTIPRPSCLYSGLTSCSKCDFNDEDCPRALYDHLRSIGVPFAEGYPDMPLGISGKDY